MEERTKRGAVWIRMPTVTASETLTIRQSGSDVLISGFGVTDQRYPGVTRIIGMGGLGNDNVNFSGVTSIPIEFNGGVGDDIIIGGGAADVLTGGIGNDTIEGGGGADAIFGGAGADILKGDDGNDTIEGGEGNDKLFGGPGDDFLTGGLDNDEVDGGPGVDYHQQTNDTAQDTGIEGLDNAGDVLDLSQFAYDLLILLRNNSITATDPLGNVVFTHDGLNFEKIIGGSGNDKFEIWQIGPGGTAFDGVRGSDEYEINLGEMPSEPGPITVQDTGPVFFTDRLIVNGSPTIDTLGVTQVAASFENETRDKDTLALFNVEFDKLFTGSSSNDNFELSAIPNPLDKDYVFRILDDGVDRGKVTISAPQTLSDLAAKISAVNAALSNAGLGTQYEAFDDGGTARLRRLGDQSADGVKVRRVQITPITFSPEVDGQNVDPGLELVQINGRDGDDIMNIQGTPEGIPIEITAGLGSDTVNVGVFVYDPDNTLPVGTPQNLNSVKGDTNFGLPLQLAGNDFNPDDLLVDTFTVRAFALFGQEVIDELQQETQIDGGAGADLVRYTVNAHGQQHWRTVRFQRTRRWYLGQRGRQRRPCCPDRAERWRHHRHRGW